MIDPRISMGVRAPDVGSLLNSIQARKSNQQAMDQRDELFPLQIQQQQQALEAGRQTLDTNKQSQMISSVAAAAPTLRKLIQGGDALGALNAMNQLKSQFKSTGLDTAIIDEGIQELINGNANNILPSLEIAENYAVNSGITKKGSFAAQVSPVYTDPDGTKYNIITEKGADGTARSYRQNIEGAIGLTAEQEAENKAAETRMVEQEKSNVQVRENLINAASNASIAAFEQLPIIRSNISLYDDAIKALDDGASSGPFQSLLPSLREETIRLENVANRLGLNVVAATTFGALSEGELKLAMNTAVPTNLQPNDLKVWLQNKKEAQKKMANELRKMAITLGRGDTTISEYLEKVGYQESGQDDFKSLWN